MSHSMCPHNTFHKVLTKHTRNEQTIFKRIAEDKQIIGR